MSDRLTRILIATLLLAGGVALIVVRTQSDDVVMLTGIAASCIGVTLLIFEYVLLWLQSWSAKREPRGFPVVPTARKAPEDSPQLRDLNNVR
jgi:hypothetical protein